MPQTPNHGYNVPEGGAQDWHEPLNENFEDYDTDIEIRDADDNKSSYDPKPGAKFLATDTGRVYVGDGSSWTAIATTGPEPEFDEITVNGPLGCQSLLAFESIIPSINPNGENDLGVGTKNPATRLHVTDDTATQGATDLSRPAAVIENTSGDPKGDMLGLKTRVSNPDSDTDFLSFIAATNQLGQLNGNGSNGIRLGATGDLTLSAGGADAVTVDGGDATVEVGDIDTTRSSPALHLKDNKEVSNRMQPLLRLERASMNPGIDFVSQDRLDARLRPNQNMFRFDFLLEKDPLRKVYIGGGGLQTEFDVSAGGDLLADGNGGVDGDFDIGGDLDVEGGKNFVQSVDTDDGEKEVVYTSTEAPTPRTEASGVAELTDGNTEIDLPEHFGWVTDGDEPLVVETTPYSADSGGLAVVERSPDQLVVVDLDGDGDYEFSYTVKGTREGYADKQVVREPAGDPDHGAGVAADD